MGVVYVVSEGELMKALETVGKQGFAYAWQKLRNHDDALDAVQASLTAVWQHRRKLDPDRDVRGWFYRVLRNKCIDTMRQRRTRATASLEIDPPSSTARRTGREPDSSNPSDGLERAERVACLRAALEALADDAREILLLRDFHDLSYAQIARVLDVPAGTVMSRLHRARSALRSRMLAEQP